MTRWLAVSWAIGLGLLSGAIAGTFAPATSPGQEVRHVVGLSIVFVPALYVVMSRHYDLWRATNGYVRFGVYLVSFLVATGVLVGLTVTLLGSTGSLVRGAAFAAAMAAFAIASWLTFAGGADRIWAELIERDVVEW